MMSITKKRGFAILFRTGFFLLVATFAMVVLYGGWLGVRDVMFILGFEKVISEDKYFLIHHVDFEVLREAADQLHEQTLKTNPLEDDRIVPYSPDSKDLPPALRILKPNHIFVENQRVCIEFGSVLSYFGIIVDTPGAKEAGQRKIS